MTHTSLLQYVLSLAVFSHFDVLYLQQKHLLKMCVCLAITQLKMLM